ncbi:MAG: twin-arginine translocase subunit TatC [Pirellulales bacterium]
MDEWDENQFENTKMTFGEHLDELRAALIKSVLALAIGFGIALWPPIAGGVVEYVQTPLKEALTNYYQGVARREALRILEELRLRGLPVPENVEAAADLIAKEGLVPDLRFVDPGALADALEQVAPGGVDRAKLPEVTTGGNLRDRLIPLMLYHKLEHDPRLRVVGLSVQEPFSVYIKAALVVGTVAASPFIFFFLWNFVAVGLYPHEKRYVHTFLPISLGLFLAGVMLAFFVVFRFVLTFLFQFYDWLGIDPDPRITDWLTFVLILPLGFGISFQLPLVMLFLERIGVFRVADYLGHWRISVLVIFILAMVLTPNDVYSMMLMALPLIVLYFAGVLMCKYMPRRGPSID